VSIVYSFFFTFLLANTLVALVQGSYCNIVDNETIWDTRLKMGILTYVLNHVYNHNRLMGRMKDWAEQIFEFPKWLYLVLPKDKSVMIEDPNVNSFMLKDQTEDA
jgi:hypothetical protein